MILMKLKSDSIMPMYGAGERTNTENSVLELQRMLSYLERQKVLERRKLFGSHQELIIQLLCLIQEKSTLVDPIFMESSESMIIKKII